MRWSGRFRGTRRDRSTPVDAAAAVMGGQIRLPVRLSLLTTLAGLMLGLGACGNANTAPTSTAGATSTSGSTVVSQSSPTAAAASHPTVDVCGKVTAQQVGQIIGKSVTANATMVAGVSGCKYVTSDNGQVEIDVQIDSSLPAAQTDFVQEAGAGSQSVAGIGEKAAFQDIAGFLLVLKGTTLVAVEILSPDISDPTVVLADDKQIAQLMLDKLG